VLELKRPLNGLKKNQYAFQDMSDNADNTFKVTDLPDKFLLGKNSFKLHLKEDILVFRSQVYIDIVDSQGNPVYYKIISDNLPNKERIVAVYIYETTSVGDCEIIIAGRLAVNPKTGRDIPYSNEPSSVDYHGIPNVAWRKVVQVNPQESEDKIYYSVPPTITYSEVRKPQYQLSTDNRLVSLTPTSSGRATMYSNRGQLTTNDTIKVSAGGHLLNPDTSSATFVPITPVNSDNEIASLYFAGFTLSSSMEGGRVYVNNISYSYPSDASVTQSRVINYSGSIVKVVSENLCYVNPPLYQVIPYTDIYGNSKDLVVSGFSESSNFTASFRTEPTITTDSASYDSYIRLQIKNTEPEIGSVKSVSVKAKQINKPGKVVDLGTFKVDKKNILIVDSNTYTMTSKGIEPMSLGNFRKLGTVTNYWTGSNTIGFATDFANDSNVLDGVKYPSTEYVMQSENDFAEFRLRSQYYPTVYTDTEYQLTFDLLFQNKPSLVVPRQVDVYISGSNITVNTDIRNATLPPLKNSRFGTYIGSIDTAKTSRHAVKMYFTAEESGTITPVFVNRSMSNIYGNIELSVRNEPGYSSKFLDLEIPLPSEFSSRSELELEVDYLNTNNEGANYKSNLYGVVFQGNTPSTGSGASTTIPPGTVSGSDQLTSSYDTRYERKGTGILSSSNQIASDISGSFTNVSSSLAGRVYSLEQTTGSLNTFTGSANTRLNSLEAITASLTTYTGSNNTRLNIIEQTTGSLNTFTGSANTRLNNIETITGSFNTYTGSNNTRLNTIEQTTGSLNSYTGSANTRFNLIEIRTGSYATTGSNTFIGNQKITGSVDITGSLVVLSATGSFSGSFQGMPSSSAQIKALLPTGVTSGSEQLTSSYDTRYERKGTGIYSSSQQIGPTGIYSSSGVAVPNAVVTIPINSTFRFRFSSSGVDAIALSDATGETILSSPDGLASVSLVDTGVFYLVGLGSLDLIGGDQSLSFNLLTGSFSDNNGQGLLYGGNYTASILKNDRFIPDVGVVKLIVTQSANLYTSSYNNIYERKGTGILSSSAQIGSDVSGSFTDVSSSLSRRVYSIEQTTGSLNAFTGSASTRLNNIELTTGSLNNYTGSNNTRLNTIEQTTGSLNTYTGSANTRFNLIEIKTGSYATTGSNTFKADQTISGSLIVTGSLTVDRATGSFSGSFDGQYSSSAQVNYDQITNKPNLLTPGQYRVLTSDGTESGSQANKDFTYISSSTINRVRQSNMSEMEQAVSSSFWSTNITYVTQSIFVVSGTTNMFMNFPIYKDNESYTPITSSVHHVSYAIKIETHIYGITGSLALPRNFYNWAHTVEFRAFHNAGTLSASPLVSGLTIQTSSRNNSGSLGGYGTTYSGRPDINSWVNILGIVDAGNGNLQLRTQMTSTGSGNWTMYMGCTCKVMKHEIRV